MPSEASTFTCIVDTRPALPCTSPFKAKFKKRGKHTVLVVATDTVGNVDPTPATYTWKIKKKKKKKRPHHQHYHQHCTALTWVPRRVTSFSASTHAEAVVLAPQQEIWDVLVDPELMARFTPFLESITADGDHWRWQLSGLDAAGREGGAGVHRADGVPEPDRIEFRHDPPAGTTEQAGVAGWYALTPDPRRDRAGHRARDHPRPAAAEGVGTGRARRHAQGHRHHGRPLLRSLLLAHLGAEAAPL